jgi:hypothetical protein
VDMVRSICCEGTRRWARVFREAKGCVRRGLRVSEVGPGDGERQVLGNGGTGKPIGEIGATSAGMAGVMRN